MASEVDGGGGEMTRRLGWCRLNRRHCGRLRRGRYRRLKPTSLTAEMAGAAVSEATEARTCTRCKQ